MAAPAVMVELAELAETVELAEQQHPTSKLASLSNRGYVLGKVATSVTD
jgi:hypothetical protein